jgi:hypothetical protein
MSIETEELDGFYADACVTVACGTAPPVPNAPDPSVLHEGLIITIEPILGTGGRPLVLTA